MKPIDPRVDPNMVPEGSRPVLIAKNQKGYTPLPVIRTPNHRVISRWELTYAERQAIAKGEDVFLTILAAGQVQPVMLTVGAQDATSFWKQGQQQAQEE